VRIYDLAKNLIRLSGYKPNVDMKIEVCGLRPGENFSLVFSPAFRDFAKRNLIGCRDESLPGFGAAPQGFLSLFSLFLSFYLSAYQKGAASKPLLLLYP
ncbi:MAG: polysaccharide biosynthesis protein, partial [Firmicutes bacterium]|nr:polysaccharide biosynthesis protein [Bacillota bacterium]